MTCYGNPTNKSHWIVCIFPDRSCAYVIKLRPSGTVKLLRLLTFALLLKHEGQSCKHWQWQRTTSVSEWVGSTPTVWAVNVPVSVLLCCGPGRRRLLTACYKHRRGQQFHHLFQHTLKAISVNQQKVTDSTEVTVSIFVVWIWIVLFSRHQ